MEQITIRIIYDNCNADKNLQAGWGFSALIETGRRKILFDTGNDKDAFFSNVEKMGIDLRKITDIVFSHKHNDHITGCEEVLEKLPDHCSVYFPKGFPSKKVPKNLQVHKVKDFVDIDKNVYSMALKGGFFLHEQSLIIQIEKGLVIVTGCAHPGIVNIIESAQEKLKQPIYLALGGFHLFKNDRHFVEKLINKFQTLQVQKVAPCHCSGEKAIGQFQEAYLEDFYEVGTGSVLKL
jgi:7,8-dihydropterin-6-yl-methyl-4-(beta-D-ribofuranosyl)aminobenzene 5'-phosphate synthase